MVDDDDDDARCYTGIEWMNQKLTLSLRFLPFGAAASAALLWALRASSPPGPRLFERGFRGFLISVSSIVAGSAQTLSIVRLGPSAVLVTF